ncbi:GIY-YIG nuclease family protein [Flagellimonas algicola]|uniref:GIY-YIG nuclease family protein n=1 Tax=Flagellimonas algicola TaxID=2583815 RepID=A0ABY2WIL1_9FLAO|nr:GIY-YIG nuclease family protein [Allomuricauda algicola]TMU54543.1 GIY-YIG nuclease family protein [Allomuricauda algicola]
MNLEKGYVYMLTNASRTILYIGATRNIKKRIRKHIDGTGAVFTKKYHLKILIYYEEFDDVELAFKREKQLKNWKKDWKWNLVKSKNKDLLDLLNVFC